MGNCDVRFLQEVEADVVAADRNTFLSSLQYAFRLLSIASLSCRATHPELAPCNIWLYKASYADSG
jgi:hypothetical protein